MERNWEATKKISSCIAWGDVFDDLFLAISDYMSSYEITEELKDLSKKALYVVEKIISGKENLKKPCFHESGLNARFCYRQAQEAGKSEPQLNDEIENEFPRIKPALQKLSRGEEILDNKLKMVHDFSEAFAKTTFLSILTLAESERCIV